MARAMNPTERRNRRIARQIIRGETVKNSLVSNGISPKQARKGMTELLSRKGMRQAFTAELRKMKDLEAVIPDANARKALVRIRLIRNVLAGTDAGVQSAKLLGQDRELALWQ